MGELHEYTVKGHPKEKIIFWIATIAVVSSPLIVRFLNFLLNDKLNLTFNITLSASVIYGGLYWIFKNCLWKHKLFEKIFKFPNLNGEYSIEAVSLKNPTGNEIPWKGKLIIEQTWDKMIITIKTHSSTSYSKSVVGAIRYVNGLHYELYYYYENNPDASEKELNKHEGLANLKFNINLQSAEGYYFNNVKERESYGIMKVKRGV